MIALFFLFGPAGFSQVNLGMGGGKVIYNFTDTVCQTQTTSFYVWVRNYGPSDFIGQVGIYTAVDTGSGFTTVRFDTAVVSLPSGDSLPITTSETWNASLPCRIGTNIVVIWPIASGANTLDSTLHTNLFVKYCTGIEEKGDDEDLSIYPNPASTAIFIHKKSNAKNIERVRITDMTGRVLLAYDKTEKINIASLSEGIYFLEIYTADEQRTVYRILKQSK